MLEYLFYRAVKLNAGVFFAEKICLICISRNGNLNISLTYHIVSFDEWAQMCLNRSMLGILKQQLFTEFLCSSLFSFMSDLH